jgi:alkylmercury lyase
MVSETRRITAVQLEDAFTRTEGAATRRWLWRPLLGLLLTGQPARLEEIATATGHPAGQVRQALAALPSLEWDEQQRVVGYGLTLRPTPHQFTVGATRLYTWCALDTLIFTGVLGCTARIESSCHATGSPVRFTAGPTTITSFDPPTTVVCLVTPDAAAPVRAAFCDHVHFFANPAAARIWLQEHPGAALLPVHEAHELATMLGMLV